MSEEKNLYIIRHGKSSWGYENVSDIDRPLKNKGIKYSYEMADRLLRKGWKPDAIWSSPANRAIHTALIFAGVLEYPYNKIKIEERLYFSSEEDVLDVIHKTNDAILSLMIVGHNPTFTNVANHFLKESVDYIPTAGVVKISFNAESWMRVAPSGVKDYTFDYPKKGE